MQKVWKPKYEIMKIKGRFKKALSDIQSIIEKVDEQNINKFNLELAKKHDKILTEIYQIIEIVLK